MVLHRQLSVVLEFIEKSIIYEFFMSEGFLMVEDGCCGVFWDPWFYLLKKLVMKREK
jgi:hypothetical protein